MNKPQDTEAQRQPPRDTTPQGGKTTQAKNHNSRTTAQTHKGTRALKRKGQEPQQDKDTETQRHRHKDKETQQQRDKDNTGIVHPGGAPWELRYIQESVAAGKPGHKGTETQGNRDTRKQKHRNKERNTKTQGPKDPETQRHRGTPTQEQSQKRRTATQRHKDKETQRPKDKGKVEGEDKGKSNCKT